MVDRLAVLQNSIGIGGRSKVISEAIRTLTDETTKVDILTFSDRSAFRQFRDHYGLSKVDISHCQYSQWINPPIGTIYQQILLNYLAQGDLKEYDCVFNSNNCLQFLPDTVACINYIHQPLPSIPEITGRYHVSPSLRAYALPMRLLQWMKGCPDLENHLILANSQFIAKQYARHFGGSPDDVVYPPCLQSLRGSDPASSGVATLGAFHPNKRQLFQITIAKRLPELDFTIMGQLKSERYYQRCTQKIEAENIDNVSLVPNADTSIVRETLAKSRFFLHSMEYEEFGISVVEAMNEGCIPVVHDSGGMPEVVPAESLRYETEADCTAIIQRFRNQLPELCEGIEEHLQPFTNETFRRTIRDRVRVYGIGCGISQHRHPARR